MQSLVLMDSQEVSCAAIRAMQVILSASAWEEEEDDRNYNKTTYWCCGLDVLVFAAEQKLSDNSHNNDGDLKNDNIDSVLRVASPVLSEKSRVELVNTLLSFLRGRVARHFIDDDNNEIIDRILNALDVIIRSCGTERELLVSSTNTSFTSSTTATTTTTNKININGINNINISQTMLSYPQRAFIENVVKVIS